ncbi:AAA family ATPase [Streptomyces sp. NRRL B-24484]|uniref:AAA family ATPase n=1 Tax=Streptomyces sp. NRRL B-24484 TaxID=1463833 RepID=UPI0004BF4C76|nr:LuxR family transcriptional regulator [Streptomyces sp. NRRL B-24484]
MLYGRAGEQAQVRALLDAARGGRSGALVLRGEPGIGKTALLDAAARDAGDFRIVRAAGIEYEAELPFAGLHLLLAPALDRLDALPGPQRRALQGAFGLADTDPGDRLLLGLAAQHLLAELAAEQPLLCLVDDAQWLDQASAGALLVAARRLREEGVVLLFAARDGEGAFPAGGLPELRPAPLGRADAERLLPAALDPAVRRRVLAEAHGNPLALTELPAALGTDQPAGPLPLPGRLQLAFHGRLTRLPAATQTLLLVAATEETGDPATVLAAAAALGAGPADLPPAEQDGLVRAGDTRIAFHHPLLRAAVLQRAPLDQRLAVHRALAGALDGDRRTWHLALAATGPDAALADALEEAAHRAEARGGHAGAAAAHERAARLTADPDGRTRRLVLAAEAAADAGETDRAEQLAVRARSRTADPLALALIDHLRATAAFLRGDHPAAFRLLLDAAAGDIAAPHAARMLFQACHAAWYLGETELGAFADRLAALDLPPEDPAAPIADYLLAGTLPLLGRPAQAPPDAAGAVDRARRAGADVVRDFTQLSGITLVLGRDEETHRVTADLIDEARRAGAVGALPTLLFFHAEAQLFHGRHRDAEVTAAEGLSLARDTGQHQWTSQLAALLALLAALAGDADRCTAHVAEALAGSGPARPAGRAWTQWALGLLDLGEGRAAEALDRLAELTGGPQRHHVSGTRAVPDLVEAAVRLGRPEQAEEPYRRFARWTEACDRPWARALLLRCQALLGPDELAEDAYLAALDLHRTAERPFEQARTALLYGEWLRRTRRRTDARPQLRAALEAFDLLGARPWAERARTELTATGVGAPAAPAAGPLAGLTPQELQIVRLAGQGLTNRDIAAQLFLSPRTVGHHLYKAYPKLGITSRQDLADLL